MAGVALSSSGDSVTRVKLMGGPEVDADTSEVVTDCIGPSSCGIGEICWVFREFVTELVEKLGVRGGIGKWVGGSGKDPRDAIERTLPSS
jgi:hypothetical protein